MVGAPQPQELISLYNLLSSGKIVHHSTYAIEGGFFNIEHIDFSNRHEHQEVGFSIPYTSDFEENIKNIIIKIMPEYDMIIWRVKPEIIFYRYVRPLRISDWMHNRRAFGSQHPQVDTEITNEEHAEFVLFYTRFSIGNKNKVTHVNRGVENG